MKRRLWAALAIGGFILAGVAVVALSTRGPRIDREAFETVREGMTRGEVERALGGTPRNECRGPVEVWVRGEDGGLRSAELAPSGPPVRFFPAGDEAVWVGEDGLVAVQFGDDGRVRQKYFSTVYRPSGPSARGFVSRWFE